MTGTVFRTLLLAAILGVPAGAASAQGASSSAASLGYTASPPLVPGYAAAPAGHPLAAVGVIGEPGVAELETTGAIVRHPGPRRAH